MLRAERCGALSVCRGSTTPSCAIAHNAPAVSEASRELYRNLQKFAQSLALTIGHHEPVPASTFNVTKPPDMEPDKLDNLASGLPAGDAESESTAEALSSGFVISAPVLARLDAEPEQHVIAMKSDLLSGDRPEDSSESPWQWFPSSPVNFADSDGFGVYDTNDFPLFPQSNGMELFTPIQVVSGKSHSRDSSVDVTGPEDYEQAFDCSECSIVFGTQDELSSHDAMKHPGSNLNAWAYRPFFPATKSPACGLFEARNQSYMGLEIMTEYANRSFYSVL